MDESPRVFCRQSASHRSSVDGLAAAPAEGAVSVNRHATAPGVLLRLANDAATVSQRRQLPTAADFADLTSTQSQVGEVTETEQQLLANQQQPHRVDHLGASRPQKDEQTQADKRHS